jgi:hypothetical protein
VEGLSEGLDDVDGERLGERLDEGERLGERDEPYAYRATRKACFVVLVAEPVESIVPVAPLLDQSQ